MERLAVTPRHEPCTIIMTMQLDRLKRGMKEIPQLRERPHSPYILQHEQTGTRSLHYPKELRSGLRLYFTEKPRISLKSFQAAVAALICNVWIFNMVL